MSDDDGHSASEHAGARFWSAFTDILPTVATPQSVWETALARSYKGLYKATDADAIIHVADGNQIKHEPVVWNHERDRYEHVDDESVYWNAAAEGRNEYRATDKQVPAVWAASQSHELGSHVQAEVAQALDLGADRELYAGATVAKFDVGPGELANGAVADGGQPANQSHISVESPGEFADLLVPVGASAHGDTDAQGAVVSMQKYQEVYPEVATSEEMKQQEIRGRLSEQQRDGEELMKTALLYAALIIIGALAATEVLPVVLGGGGGGSGGGLLGLLPLLGPRLRGGD